MAKAEAFAAFPRPLRQIDRVVSAKRPFAGPEAVLAYLSRYTQRVAIANSFNSNPHSAIRLLASSCSARGFLPRGLSDAYRRPL